MAALLEILRILRLAQRLGGTRRRAVGQSVLHVIGYGLVEHLARDVAVLHAQAVAPVGVHGRLTDRLEGLFAVEAPDALHDGVRHRYDARVAHHAVGLVAPQMPHRKAALLVGDMQHRLHDVGHLLGMQHRHQRHRRPVGVPQREGRIVREIGVAVDRMVRTVVVAVHVAEERRGDHRMVKGRIENPAGRLVRSLDLHLRQFIVPRLVGGLRRCVEIPSGEFRRKVFPSALHAYGRKGYFHEHLLAVRRAERCPGVVIADGFEFFEGFRELRDEVDPLVFGPARRVTPARHRPVALLCEMRLRGLVPAAAVLQIEDHGCGVRRRERVAVESHARRGGHLGRNAVAHKRNRVITGFRDLPRTVGIGPKTRCRIILRAPGVGHLARDGHDRHVEQIADARAAQMRVREADHRRIARMVARAPVPRLRNARRTHLHQAEGDVGSHEDVPVAACADLRIDMARVILLRGRLRARAQQGRGE